MPLPSLLEAVRPFVGPTAVVVLLAVPASAQSQGACDPDILRNAARGDSHAYQDRGGERCEGIYASDVSGTEMWLASLTESFDAFEFDYEPLHVSWASRLEGDLQIRAVGTATGLYYRMDRIQPASADGYDWDSELLAVREIGRESLGLLAWRGAGAERLFVPLRVTQGAVARPWSGNYTVVIMPQVSLRAVFVTLARVDTAGDLPTGPPIRDQKRLDQSLFVPRRPFEIVLDDVGEAGVYYVKITGQQGNGASADMDAFWFHHVGN